MERKKQLNPSFELSDTLFLLVVYIQIEEWNSLQKQ